MRIPADSGPAEGSVTLPFRHLTTSLESAGMRETKIRFVF
jgi:hypothetical protein